MTTANNVEIRWEPAVGPEGRARWEEIIKEQLLHRVGRPSTGDDWWFERMEGHVWVFLRQDGQRWLVRADHHPAGVTSGIVGATPFIHHDKLPGLTERILKALLDASLPAARDPAATS